MAEKGDTLYFTIVRNGHKLKFPVVIKLNNFFIFALRKYSQHTA